MYNCYIYNSLSIIFEDRDPITYQAGYQIAALCVSVVLALVTGALTGFILAIPFFDQMNDEEIYEDAKFWEVSSYLPCEPSFP